MDTHPKVIWNWSQPSEKSYQGDSYLGTVLLIWEQVPEPFPKAGWTIIAFPKYATKAIPETRFVSAADGWDAALAEATRWGEGRLSPLWIKSQRKSPGEWIHGAAQKVKGWFQGLVA